ncbi:MAG TPA: sialidase family protein [Anaerolineae bacterium]|nr:sialidase family protein [Anaerolineae bacterium]
MCTGSLLLPVPAHAQDVVWDPPVRLTAEGSLVQFSAVVVDLEGGVHVFWSYTADSGMPANLLFHTYRTGEAWSEATDLFVGESWDIFARPAVACDRNNRLHLVWRGSQELFYSSVDAEETHNPRSWQKPLRLVQASYLSTSALVATPDGTLHVLYSQSQAGTNVMYLSSGDGGASWSNGEAISAIAPSDPQAPDSVSLALDSHGVLHAAWHESYPPDWLGRQILYTQSLDGGRTWALPTSLTELSAGAVWNALPNVVADARDNLFVMWACGESVGRCVQKSVDGGASWGGAARLFGALLGAGGRDAMAPDPHGNLFWVGALRYPQALYWSSMKNGGWRDPPGLLVSEGQSPGLASAHFPQLALSEGNQLHLILVEANAGPLWYIHGLTPYSRVETDAADRPTAEPTPWATATDTARPVAPGTTASGTGEPPAPSATSTVPPQLGRETGTPTRHDPLLWSTLAAIAALSAAVFAYRRWRR